MSYFWNSNHKRQLILIILTGVMNAGIAETTDGFTTTDDHYVDTTTDFPDVTSTIVDTTTSESTTFDIQPIIRERDSLKDEADSLRAAVIVLGILAALFLIVIIACIVWILRKRRSSKRMKSKQDVEFSSTSGNNTQHETNATKVPALQNNTNTYTQKVTKPVTKNDGGIHRVSTEKMQQNDTKHGKSEDASAKNYTQQPKPRTVTPVDEREVYENTKSGGIVRSDSTESEVYVVMDMDEVTSETPKGVSGGAPPKASKSRNSSISENDPDDIYENCGNIPQSGENYATLDTDKEYAHHYSAL